MDIHEFRSQLRVDKNRLDDALETHAESLDHIGRHIARLEAEETALRDKRERIRARLLKSGKEDDPKVTIKELEADIERNQQFMDAQLDLTALRQELAEWRALKEAWITRGYNLKSLGDLYAQQYFAIDSAGGRRYDSRPQPRPTARQYEPNAEPSGIVRRRIKE